MSSQITKKKKKKAYLIITTGMTGSGKTSLIEKTIEYLNIKGEKYVKILIDDIIENNDKYKQEIIKILAKIKESCKDEVDCIEKKYKEPTKEMYKDFGDAYFTTRKNRCSQDSELSCDDLLDQDLKKAVKNGDHIIFEFTGQYIPKWLLDTNFIKTKYTPVFAYSIVNSTKLYERNITRAFKSIKKFENDKNLPAPRLPDVSKETLIKKSDEMKSVLKDIYENCIKSHNESKCGNVPPKILLIFDNNDSMKLIFSIDNDKNDLKFEKALEEASNGFSSKSAKTAKRLKCKMTIFLREK